MLALKRRRAHFFPKGLFLLSVFVLIWFLQLLIGRHVFAQRTKLPNPEISALVKAAQGEGKLNLSWGTTSWGGPTGVKELQTSFNKFYGTNTEFIYTPGKSFSAHMVRLAEELAAGRKAFEDIALADSGQVAFFAKNKVLFSEDWGTLVPHVPQNIMKMAAALDKTLITVISQPRTIIYNTNLVPKDRAPKSMQDLLNPMWKGKIATTPYVAGYEVLANNRSWGEKRLLEYGEALSRNLGGLIRCGELSRIISGEFWIFALECSPGRVQLEIEKGAPIAQVIPRDMQEILHHWVGVPRHAANPSTAKLFVAYLLTRQGQDIIYKHEGVDLHYLEGSRTAKQLEAVSKETGREFNDYTAQRIIDQGNVDEVLKKLSAIFRVAK